MALSAIFCWDARRKEDGIFREITANFFEAGFLLLTPSDGQAYKAFRYGETLFEEVLLNVKEIDSLISECSERWLPGRMPKVDLAIVRMAVAEAYYVKGAPLEIVIDEALEIAKLYGSHASHRFVNGVLMGIFKTLGLADPRLSP